MLYFPFGAAKLLVEEGPGDAATPAAESPGRVDVYMSLLLGFWVLFDGFREVGVFVGIFLGSRRSGGLASTCA